MQNLEEMAQYIIHDVNEITDLFYQQNTAEAYKRLEDVLSELIRLIDMAYEAEKMGKFHIENLASVLKDTLHAMEKKDSILVADIMKYDMVSELENILKMTEKG